MANLRKAMGKVPVFVQMAFIKYACNAWTTTARFNRDVTPCRWCGLYRGGNLRHYTTCTTMLSALAERHPVLHASWVVYRHPPGAYGLDLPSCEVAVELLLWVDFLAFLYSSCQDLVPADGWCAAWNARARVRNRYG
jgi:hypothetical protein